MSNLQDAIIRWNRNEQQMAQLNQAKALIHKELEEGFGRFVLYSGELEKCVWEAHVWGSMTDIQLRGHLPETSRIIPTLPQNWYWTFSLPGYEATAHINPNGDICLSGEAENLGLLIRALGLDIDYQKLLVDLKQSEEIRDIRKDVLYNLGYRFDD